MIKKIENMTLKQLTIFLENKSGRLTEVLEALGNEKINITALSIADTSEFGLLRMIVSEPEKACEVLKSDGFTVKLAEVLLIKTPAEAGSFAKAMRIFSDEGLSIEYLYGFSANEKAMIILRTEDTAKALAAITKHKMKLLRASDLFEF
jgi:hypothetical protein